MDYETDAKITGAFLALLFVIYAWQKKRGAKVEKKEDPYKNPYEPSEAADQKPDIISKTAGGIVHAHHFFSKIMGFIFIAVVIGMTFYDSMVRIIVISTVVVMLVIGLVYRLTNRRK